MKKVFLLLVAIISLSVAASAQKFGHITTDDIIQAMPETKVFEDIREYLKSEKKVSEEGIAQVSALMPVFASDFVAYEDMKAYLIDEDADLQETNQDLELIDLIGVKNWLVQKLNGTATV